MGVALAALRDVELFVRHNPIVAVIGSLGAVLMGVTTLTPTWRFANVLLVPLFGGGMAGITYAGRDGNARAVDFLTSIRGWYDSLLAGYLLFGLAIVGTLALPIAWTAVLTYLFGVSADVGVSGALEGILSGVPGGSIAADLDVLFLPVVVLWLGLLLVLFALAQLFDVVIVVENRPVADGFGRAWELFTAAPASVLGYTLVRGAITLVAVGLPLALFAATGAPLGFQTESILPLLGSLAFVCVLLPVWFVVTEIYHVAYYNRLVVALASNDGFSRVG